MINWRFINQNQDNFDISLPNNANVLDAKGEMIKVYNIKLESILDPIKTTQALDDQTTLIVAARKNNFFHVITSRMATKSSNAFVPPPVRPVDHSRLSTQSNQQKSYINIQNDQIKNPHQSQYFNQQHPATNNEVFVPSNSHLQSSKSYSTNQHDFNEHQSQSKDKFLILLGSDLDYNEKTLFLEIYKLFPNKTNEVLYRTTKYFKDINRVSEFMLKEENERDEILSKVSIPSDQDFIKLEKEYNSKCKQFVLPPENIKKLVESDPNLMDRYLRKIEEADIVKAAYIRENMEKFLEYIGADLSKRNENDEDSQLYEHELDAVSEFTHSQQNDLKELILEFRQDSRVCIRDIIDTYKMFKFNKNKTRVSLNVSLNAY